MSIINLVPMAGEGNRFKEKGYMTPKPLIEVQGLPMIIRALGCLPKAQKNILIVEKSAKLFIIVALFQLFDSAQVIILGALRGMQDVKIPTVIVFIAYWVIGFPISFYFGDINMLQEIGIWIGLLCGLLFSAVFLYLRFNFLTNKKINSFG